MRQFLAFIEDIQPVSDSEILVGCRFMSIATPEESVKSIEHSKYFNIAAPSTKVGLESDVETKIRGAFGLDVLDTVVFI